MVACLSTRFNALPAPVRAALPKTFEQWAKVQILPDGDTIRAVIRSSGSNSNGKSAAGLTQPSPEAQYNLIRDTYTKAGLDLASTRFVEAHGTGTI